MTYAAMVNDSGLFGYLYLHKVGNQSVQPSVMYACDNGNFEIMDILEANHIDSHSVQLSSSNLSFLERIYSTYGKIHGRTWSKTREKHSMHIGQYYSRINKAAEYGHKDLLRYLLDDNPLMAWDGLALVNAAGGGHLDVVKMLHFHKGPPMWLIDGARAMEFAAEHGYIKVVRFLHESRTEGCSSYALTMASMNGHYDVVEYLLNNRTEGQLDQALKAAVRHPDIVRLLMAKGANVGPRERQAAAIGGYLESLLMWPCIKVSGTTIGSMYSRDNVLEADYIIQEYGSDRIEHQELFMRLAGRRGNDRELLAKSIIVGSVNGPVIIYRREQGMVGLMVKLTAAGHLDPHADQ
eukprot:gene7923-9308_t